MPLETVQEAERVHLQHFSEDLWFAKKCQAQIIHYLYLI